MKIKNIVQKNLLMMLGQNLFRKRKYQSALEKFALALDIDNGDSFIYLWIGFCLTELEKYDEAHEKYLEAISKDPDNIALKAFLATNYVDRGFVHEALDILSPLISLPNIPRPVFDSYGLCLLMSGKFDDAHKFLTSHANHLGASGISPRVFTFSEIYLSEHTDICYELYENIDAELAESLYLRIKGKISDLFSNVAFWNKSKHESHKLLTLAEKAVDQNDYPKAKQLLGHLPEAKSDKKTILLSAWQFIRMKDYSSAVRIIDLADDSKKTHRIKSLKTLVLLRLGDLKRAETLLNEISKGEDNVLDISYLRGLLYIEQGSTFKARKMFEKTLEIANINFGLDLTAIRLKEILRVFNLAEKHN